VRGTSCAGLCSTKRMKDECANRRVATGLAPGA
jgi:hypothetical protein